MAGAKEAGHTLVTAQCDDLSDIDRATVERCIDVVVARSSQLKDKGLSSWSFFLGVANLVIVTWFFGVFPQHFWAVYIFETIVLFPIRYKHMAAAQPSQVLYWLDFCWVANFLCNLSLIIYIIDAYFCNQALGFLMALDSDQVRKLLFCSFFCIATGPLLLAVGALRNALVFHDADNTVSVFIHLGPSLLVFTMRWQSERIIAAWPGLFSLDYLDSVSPLREVYMYGLMAYFAWFTLYTGWLICCGLSTPAKGYDTIFHYTMRGSNPVSSLLGWSKEEQARRAANNDFNVASVLLYMLFHATACSLAMLLSVVCWMSQYAHGGMCLTMTLVAIYNGSARYSYYIADYYTSILKKEFADALKKEPAP